MLEVAWSYAVLYKLDQDSGSRRHTTERLQYTRPTNLHVSERFKNEA